MKKKNAVDVKIYSPKVNITRNPEKNTGKTMIYTAMSDKKRNAI